MEVSDSCLQVKAEHVEWQGQPDWFRLHNFGKKDLELRFLRSGKRSS